MMFEAQWLRLRHRTLPLPGLPGALEGLKLLHVSDLHAGMPGFNDRAIARFVDKAAAVQADLVLFTGDMVNKKKDITPYLELLGRVEARYGKFAVLGNHDHGMRKTVMEDLARRLTGKSNSRARDEIAGEDLAETVSNARRLLDRAGIRLLDNECVQLTINGTAVQVCGVDDFQYGYAEMEKTERQIDRSIPLRLLLTHSPDAIDHVIGDEYHLLLAGHTHGGQICLPHPTRGRMLLSTSGSGFGEGVYRRHGMTMHVSRGVGTTLVPFRLLSRPEITLLTLTPAAAAHGLPSNQKTA